MSQSPERLGKHMILAAWLIALGMLTWLFNLWLEGERNPNRVVDTQVHSEGIREVSLTRNRGGHYLARGAINGQSVDFMLDTGATLVAIPQEIATRLNLERGAPIEVSTANGTATAYLTRLQTVSLGEIELHNVRAAISPNMQGEILLGMSFLRKLEFTQRGDTLVLRQYAVP